MTETLQTRQALHHTAEDLRALGHAAVADFQRLQRHAQEAARAKVLEPGMQLVKDASHRLEDQARRSATAAREKVHQISGYVAENPSRALLGAFAGGVLAALLMRR